MIDQNNPAAANAFIFQSESLRSLKFLLSSQRSPSVISNALSLLCYTIREVPFALDTCGNILTDGKQRDLEIKL
jgi:hypothetical protein